MHFSKIICVAYTNSHSVKKDSRIDLKIGNDHRMVSSNQIILDRASSGDLVIIRSQNGDCVIGKLGHKLSKCSLWKDICPEYGQEFKFAWTYEPLTPIMRIDDVRKCLAGSVESEGINLTFLFNSRLCGYGGKYMSLMKDAFALNLIPML